MDSNLTEQNIKKAYDIRYIKLHFFIEFHHDCTLPVYKASALRGGMGEMLLESNCISDRECEKCEFESECIVRHTMYSKMEIAPNFMTKGDSVGYVLECEDYHARFSAGDRMQFNLILFGKTIVYFKQFLNAIYMLGQAGLGKEKSQFSIVSVTNTEGALLYDQGDLYLNEYRTRKVSDYITYRKAKLGQNDQTKIIFKSPLTIKYRGEILWEFRPDAIIEALCRRVYMLDCFEGIDSGIYELDHIKSVLVPTVISEIHRRVSMRRYSNHKQDSMRLEGIEGELVLEGVSKELLEMLIAGELIHLGKNTSFGFGRYRIS